MKKILVLLLVVFSAFSFKEVHPFHVTLLQFKYDNAEQTYQVSCKMFINDFENILKKNHQAKVDFYKECNDDNAKRLFRLYLDKNLWIGTADKTLNYSILGAEREDDALWIYLETEAAPSPKDLKVKSTILYDLFEDEINIVQLEQNKQKKSFKNGNPKSESFFVIE
jgi:hypothetical protein